MVVFMKNILADNCYFRGRRWDDEHAVKAMVFFHSNSASSTVVFS